MKKSCQILFFAISFIVATCFSQYTSTQAQTTGANASLTLQPEATSSRAGEQFTTEVWIDTDSVEVGGVGAKLLFDPKLLQVVNIETTQVFPDYPAKSFDNVTGTVTISGIVQSKNQFYTGKAAFATITWKSLTSGDAIISFNFIPGSTKDSNIAVTFGNGDILQKTNTTKVKINPVTSQESLIENNETAIEPTTSQTELPINPADQKSKTSFTLLEICLTIGLLACAISQMYLYKQLKNLQKYKEAVPHLHIPNN